ncbi:DUF393 domain-containing protein [Streptomyces anulatus]|uniref:thiol-disulfide oxidoreductase DCC family protein n=1 Tax=Streptomyces anulatus TaxID=1892 RepID=UPI00386AEB54|nr:DUF393 domain-containing protein [Streptomyces anulatus]
MNNSATGDAEGRTVLAFDGDRGFCQTAVRQIQLRARPRTAAVAWQTLPPQLTEPHLNRLDREVLLFDGNRIRAGGVAALAALLGSSPARAYRGVGMLLRLPLIRPAANLVYRWVARNRQRMPGGTAACAVPRAGQRPARCPAPATESASPHAPGTRLRTQQLTRPPGQPRPQP